MLALLALICFTVAAVLAVIFKNWPIAFIAIGLALFVARFTELAR